MRITYPSLVTGHLSALLLLAVSLALAGCSTEGGGRDTVPEEPTVDSGTTLPETTRETTQEMAQGAVAMSIEQIAEGQRGPARRQLVVSGSARGLSEAAGVDVPDAGESLYVSAHAGERPTGGYRVSLSLADSGEVRVSLRKPGQGDMVTQALTQPYAVAVLKSDGELPDAGELRFVDAEGRPLGWPVREA